MHHYGNLPVSSRYPLVSFILCSKKIYLLYNIILIYSSLRIYYSNFLSDLFLSHNKRRVDLVSFSTVNRIVSGKWRSPGGKIPEKYQDTWEYHLHRIEGGAVLVSVVLCILGTAAGSLSSRGSFLLTIR